MLEDGTSVLALSKTEWDIRMKKTMGWKKKEKDFILGESMNWKMALLS